MTSSSLPAPMIAKLVTRKILSEHTTCSVVLGVEISEAADKLRFDTRKGGKYSGWPWWAHEANRGGTASKVDYLNTESCSYRKSLTDSSDTRPQNFINRLETTQGMVLTQHPAHHARSFWHWIFQHWALSAAVLYAFERKDLRHQPDYNQASRIEEHYSFLIFNAKCIATAINNTLKEGTNNSISLRATARIIIEQKLYITCAR